MNVRYVMIRPVRLPYSLMPVSLLMFTKIRNSGSRNRMPGNIWVDRTVMEKTCRPWNRYRLTAYAARIATITEATARPPDTIRLFTR